MTFWISQGKVAIECTSKVGKRNVQAVNLKFSQDLTHQKSLKSVNFWQELFEK